MTGAGIVSALRITILIPQSKPLANKTQHRTSRQSVTEYPVLEMRSSVRSSQWKVLEDNFVMNTPSEEQRPGTDVVDTSKITGKLELLLSTGITTEVQAVYLMVGIRKLLEHQQAKKQYKDLKFHCDWALHSKLEGSTAQGILKLFDAANIHLKTGVEFRNLPSGLRTEIERITKMKYFEEQLEDFLKSNGLPSMDTTRSDGWIHFEHLYAKVVEDSPLVMKAKNTSASVASVTLKVDLAKASKQDGGDMLFKVRWIILDKNGMSGEVYVLNSFESP